jgi:hypothetical protein
VSLGAFRKDEYFYTQDTVVVVIADRVLSGYEVAQWYQPPFKKKHTIAFPNGTVVSVTLPGKPALTTALVARTPNDGTHTLILTVEIPDAATGEFEVEMPRVTIDGETFNFGRVRFNLATESWRMVNC